MMEIKETEIRFCVLIRAEAFRHKQVKADPLGKWSFWFTITLLFVWQPKSRKDTWKDSNEILYLSYSPKKCLSLGWPFMFFFHCQWSHEIIEAYFHHIWKKYALLNHNYDIKSQNYDMLSNIYEMKSWNYD